MTNKTHSAHIDADVYQMLRDEQARRPDKISLRQLLQGYIREGIQRDKELNTFDNALSVHIDNSDDPKGFKEYLNSSIIGALIRLLDVTRPTYQDIAMIDATLVFWKIPPKEFFKTLLTYARFGLGELKGE